MCSSALVLLEARAAPQQHVSNKVTERVPQGKLTASAVGQLVGLQSEEIKQFASEYAEKVSAPQLLLH